MQFMRAIVLKYTRIKLGMEYQLLPRHGRILLPAMKKRFSQEASAQRSPENLSFLKERVMELVKKFDKIDSNKVTETADFQKDLCLDSLDRVELVMAFEQEFSIEIPDEKADKINSCADAIRYIASQPKYNTQGSS